METISSQNLPSPIGRRSFPTHTQTAPHLLGRQAATGIVVPGSSMHGSGQNKYFASRTAPVNRSGIPNGRLACKKTDALAGAKGASQSHALHRGLHAGCSAPPNTSGPQPSEPKSATHLTSTNVHPHTSDEASMVVAHSHHGTLLAIRRNDSPQSCLPGDNYLTTDVDSPAHKHLPTCQRDSEGQRSTRCRTE